MGSDTNQSIFYGQICITAVQVKNKKGLVFQRPFLFLEYEETQEAQKQAPFLSVG